jgi:hypothetical protein
MVLSAESGGFSSSNMSEVKNGDLLKSMVSCSCGFYIPAKIV